MVENSTNTVCSYKQLYRNSIGEPSKSVVHAIQLLSDWVDVTVVTSSWSFTFTVGA